MTFNFIRTSPTESCRAPCRSAQLTLLAILWIGLAGCGDRGGSAANNSEGGPPADTLNQQRASAISVTGSVTDTAGTPIIGATVSTGDATSITNASGQFTLQFPQRANRMLRVESQGHAAELISLHLLQPASVSQLALAPIVLEARPSDGQRLLFGGDTSFGRRFLDPDNAGQMTALPPDNPNAWILASSPEAGSRRLVERLLPYFQQADFRSVNLETPVTDTPSTPHPTKEFLFFTLPRSLSALTGLSVEYAGLGNNHVYDFIEDGLRSTIAHLDAYRIGHSGAGATSDAAFQPYYHALANGRRLALVAATSIDGKEHPISYVAEGTTKGGAANARDALNTSTRFTDAIRNLPADAFPIAQYHGGVEYAPAPTAYGVQLMRDLADAGARLVVSHHAHTPQGIGRHNGIYLVHGLGNLLFDQERHDTSVGLLARAETDTAGVRGLRLLPVYHKNLRPHPVGGDLAQRIIRRLAEQSQDGVLLYPHLGQGWVAPSSDAVTSIERTLNITRTIPANGRLLIDLRDLMASEESMVAIVSDRSIESQLGHDLYLFGDVESYDFGDTAFDGNHWTTGSGARLCGRGARRGMAGLCSERAATDPAPAVLSTSQRIRPEGDAVNAPNKDLSLVIYVRQLSSGPVRIETRYYASTKDRTFGGDTLIELPGGGSDWQMIDRPIPLPADNPAFGSNPETDQPRALRVFVEHGFPEQRTGEIHLDDLAVVNWSPRTTSTLTRTLPAPNAYEFLQVFAPPGPVSLQIRVRKYVPAPRP